MDERQLNEHRKNIWMNARQTRSEKNYEFKEKIEKITNKKEAKKNRENIMNERQWNEHRKNIWMNERQRRIEKNYELKRKNWKNYK